MSLSDKIEHNARMGHYHDWIMSKDVKEAVKELETFNKTKWKEMSLGCGKIISRLSCREGHLCGNCVKIFSLHSKLHDKIKEIFGDKLK